MEPLGFVFDHDAVILSGWAHRTGCAEIPPAPRSASRILAAGEAMLSERCPRACARCQPAFVTLLSSEVAGRHQRWPHSTNTPENEPGEHGR
jgi:hypothetical protein